MTVTDPHQALEQLKQGNARFAAGRPTLTTVLSDSERKTLLKGQSPLAVILGCSDARVPVELIFDQGFGELFVIRVAGNIVAPSQIGSVEFAVEQSNVSLAVVLGHSGCGAIQATLRHLREPSAESSANLRSIVDRISPGLEGLMATDLCNNEDALVRESVRANVRASVNTLRHGSEMLEARCHRGELMIVGAEYALDDGVVDFFDGVA